MIKESYIVQDSDQQVKLHTVSQFLQSWNNNPKGITCKRTSRYIR